jgi:hypothetical protein
MLVHLLHLTGILVKMSPYYQITDLVNDPCLYGLYLLPILTIIDHNTDLGSALLTPNNIKCC